jgi:hypothetical protein
LLIPEKSDEGQALLSAIHSTGPFVDLKTRIANVSLITHVTRNTAPEGSFLGIHFIDEEKASWHILEKSDEGQILLSTMNTTQVSTLVGDIPIAFS